MTPNVDTLHSLHICAHLGSVLTYLRYTTKLPRSSHRMIALYSGILRRCLYRTGRSQSSLYIAHVISMEEGTQLLDISAANVPLHET